MSWTKPEVLKLNSIWSDESIQAQLESCRHNQDVYEKISSELSEAEFSRTYQQCCKKLKKLKCEYKRIKDKRNKTDEGRLPELDYFDAIDDVLGHRPETEPAVVIDTLKHVTATEQGSGYDIPNTADPSSVTSGTNVESSEETLVSPAALTKKRKLKRSRAETMADDIVDTLVSMQAKSDQMMIELEEKQLRSEEKQREQELQIRRKNENSK